MTDIVLFPALLLATEYHRRWEVENTIDELKVHHKERKTPIREPYPREVVQEVYGWLLGHWASGYVMFQVADHAQISPLRLGNTCTLNVVTPIVPKFQRQQPEELPFFFLVGEGNSQMSRFLSQKEEAIPESSKKPAPNFPQKSQCTRGQDPN